MVLSWRTAIGGCAACVAAVVVGGAGRADAQSSRRQIVASFYPVAYAAERVGGDRVHVTNLTPAGAEPHDLELNPDQIDEVLDADIVFDLGDGFQPAVEKAAEQRDGPTVSLLRSGHQGSPRLARPGAHGGNRPLRATGAHPGGSEGSRRVRRGTQRGCSPTSARSTSGTRRGSPTVRARCW